MPLCLYPHTSFFAPTYLLLALLCKVQYRQLLIVTGKILYPLYLLVIAPFSLACFLVNYLTSQTHSKVKLKPVFFSVCLFLVSFSCYPQTKKHLLLCNALVGIPKCYSCFKAMEIKKGQAGSLCSTRGKLCMPPRGNLSSHLFFQQSRCQFIYCAGDGRHVLFQAYIQQDSQAMLTKLCCYATAVTIGSRLHSCVDPLKVFIQ